MWRVGVIATEEPLMREVEHFIDVVRRGDEPIVSGEDGKHALEVALAAINSYKSGKIISIK